MLNLHPPYLDVGNIRIYTDDTDPNTFYYVTQKPRIALGDNGKPAISIYAVVPESGVGKDNDSILETAMSIDVDLSVTDEEIDAVKKAIQSNFKQKAKTLSPAPLHKGTVNFIMAQSSDTSDSKKWFVSSGFSPSMIGTNRVSLAVRTTGEDAKRLVAALSSNEVVASIYYELEVLGITPVFNAYMKADMAMVYHHVRKSTKKNFLVYNKDIDKIINELADTRVLTIRVEEQDPDIKAEAMKTLMNELKTEVVKRFFNKVDILSNKTSASNVVEGIAGTIGGILKTIIPNYSYSRKDVNETQLTSFEVNLQQKNAKTFPISPQGQIKEMIDSANLNLKDCLSWVLLDELEVKGQTVTVKLAANTFEGNFIKSVVTYCRVIDTSTNMQVKEPETLAFDADGQADKMSKSFTYTRYKKKKYAYEYWSHIYLDAIPGLLPNPLVTKVCATESNYIYINPADYYKNFEIDLNLPDLTIFEQSKQIIAKVNVLCENHDNKVITSKDFAFDEQNADHKKLSIIAERNLNLSYTIDFTYVVPNAKDLVLNITQPQKNSILLVPNPFESKWQVDLDCVADWGTIERVILQTRINDPLQEEPIVNHFRFDGSHTSDVLKASCSLETSKWTFEYYYHVYHRDGSKTEGGWNQVQNESYVVIDVGSLKPERTVKVGLKNPSDFTNLHIAKLKVSLFPENNTPKLDQFIINGRVTEFKYPWKKGETKAYYYKFTAKDEDGREIFQKKKTLDDCDELLLEFKDN